MEKLIELLYGDAGKELNKFITEKNFEYFYTSILVFVIVTIAIFVLITWIFSQNKIKSEIDKNKVESIAIYFDLLKQVDHYRNEYLQASCHLQESIKVLIEDLHNSRSNDYWNDTANIFYNEFVDSFNKHLSYKRVVVKMDKKESLNYVDDELFKYLDTIIIVGDTMNSDDIKNVYPNSNLIISIELTKDVFRVIDEFVSIFDFRRRVKYYKYSKKMKLAVANHSGI